MSTFADVKNLASRDPQFLARLIINPKLALAKARINLTKEVDAKRVELFARMGQEQIKAVGRVTGITGRPDAWGIGYSCCNSRKIMPGKLAPRTGGNG